MALGLWALAFGLLDDYLKSEDAKAKTKTEKPKTKTQDLRPKT